ncbi:rCG37021 [Rattus norvegicus]|uniref:RCG37021 n=1 Tax=Rattus norvegicus TaxID=10116 RepID=A6HU09_RAT|nr:rCG37021 [Rattus norvegicus]
MELPCLYVHIRNLAVFRDRGSRGDTLYIYKLYIYKLRTHLSSFLHEGKEDGSEDVAMR